MQSQNRVEVRTDDTLAGICLRNKVSEQEIRRLNKLGINESIHNLTHLILPGPVVKEDAEVRLIKERSALIKEFCEESGEGKIEAEIYLSEHAWRIEFALAAWKNDDEAAAGSKFA